MMAKLLKLTGASDGAAVLVNADLIAYLRRRATGGLTGTLLMVGGNELIVRESVEDIAQLLSPGSPS